MATAPGRGPRRARAATRRAAVRHRLRSALVMVERVPRPLRPSREPRPYTTAAANTKERGSALGPATTAPLARPSARSIPLDIRVRGNVVLPAMRFAHQRGCFGEPVVAEDAPAAGPRSFWSRVPAGQHRLSATATTEHRTAPTRVQHSCGTGTCQYTCRRQGGSDRERMGLRCRHVGRGAVPGTPKRPVGILYPRRTG